MIEEELNEWEKEWEKEMGVLTATPRRVLITSTVFGVVKHEELARAFRISTNTLKIHVRQIIRRVGAENLAHATLRLALGSLSRAVKAHQEATKALEEATKALEETRKASHANVALR